jgi:hypothetical protein
MDGKMANAKRNTLARLTLRGARKNVAKQFATFKKEEAKLLNKVTSYEKELTKMSRGTIIDNAYRVDILRLRAQSVRELNSVREKLTGIEKRIVNYDMNDQNVLKDRGLYWGA